jgi:hypothetical protein
MNYRKNIRFTLVGGFLSLLVLPLSIQSSSQSQNPSQEASKIKNDQIIVCNVLEVVVSANVTGRQGEEISDLTKDDFIIYEDGVKQELVDWKRNVGLDRQADQSMYEVGYSPNTRHFKGEWRKIRVVVRNQEERKLKVEFAPSGYYAKKELVP